MVLVTIGLLSSEVGIDGSGKAVSLQSAEECEKWDPPSQMLYLRYLGHNSCASSFFAIAMLFSVAKPFAFFACMFEVAIVGSVSAHLILPVLCIRYSLFTVYTYASQQSIDQPS